MIHTQHNIRVGLVLGALLVMTSACWDTANYCTKDTDCFSNEICTNNACIVNSSLDMSNTSDMPDQGTDDMTQPGCTTLKPTRCSGVCVDTQNDTSHCGDCRKPCGDNQVCIQGACKTQSTNCTVDGCQGQTYCDKEDGLCKPGCEKDEQCGANQVCQDNTCVCSRGRHLCGDNICYKDIDRNHCGVDCVQCDTDANCVDGKCVQKSCDPGELLCNGTCAKCPENNSALLNACENGECVIETCKEGFEVCEDRTSCCPTNTNCASNYEPRAGAAINQNGPYAQQFSVSRRTKIYLTSENSTPNNNRVRWTLTPPFPLSFASLDDPEAPNTFFTTDVRGQYDVTLTTFNGNALESCKTSTITVTVP